MSKKKAEQEQKAEEEARAAASNDTQVAEEQSPDTEAGAEAAAEDPVEKLEQEIQQLKDQHLRLFADFENYKKRTAKERLDLYGSANLELMSALLPVLDDFHRALKNMEGEAEEGVRLIFQKFENTLKSKGLKPMENTVGKDFDVDTMEAVTRIPAPEENQKGKVVDEIEAGYQLGNKIIRYAKVVVGE